MIQHWLTIEISFDENVRIFDSLFLNEVSFEVKKHHEAAHVSSIDRLHIYTLIILNSFNAKTYVGIDDNTAIYNAT